MKILVLNSGSSSLKFQLFEMPEGKVLVKGLAERIGEKTGRFKANDFEISKNLPSHKEALELLTDYLLNPENQIINNKNDIEVIGHRVVHGGSSFVQPTLITEAVKNKVRELFSLAPLHNPANLTGIETAEMIFPQAKQVAVFDTAFHQSIPVYNHKYAIPETFYNNGIRKYGFHGISHQYVSREANKRLGKTDTKVITLHLGNGASATAVLNGKSYDTSMGFGPMNGLIMGTRSGDIDQSIVFYLMDKMGYSSEEVQNILNKKSGMMALAGSNDLRDIETAANNGEGKAQLALQMYAGAIKKYIGNYTAQMNGLDALVFTAGIGENSEVVRKLATQNLNYLGIDIDQNKNLNPDKFQGDITAENSNVKVFVIPTNEEKEIAQQAYDLVK
ncbi:MAG TPA: acetate kinase [Flavobacteriales bacterium]|nr:acetate kinase [Flavobacteriales bacterium]